MARIQNIIQISGASRFYERILPPFIWINHQKATDFFLLLLHAFDRLQVCFSLILLETEQHLLTAQ